MKTTHYILLCGIFLFGCVEREEPQYYEVPLTMIVKIQNGIIDTVNTEIADEYTLVNFTAPDGEPSIEFIKNGKSILKMQIATVLAVNPRVFSPGRRLREYINMSNETSISFLRIESLNSSGLWGFSKLSEDHVLIKDFPFEGINCFRYED